MRMTAVELQQRTAKLLRDLERLAANAGGGDRGRKLASKLLKACKDMEVGYRHACASSSPDEFISRISHVARNARKTKATLMLLSQLDYLKIEQTRELIFDARGLENIFVASRNTATRRANRAGVSGARRERSRAQRIDPG